MAKLILEMQGNGVANGPRTAKVDLKFEVVVIPVSDVDRARSSTRVLDGALTSIPESIATIAWFSSRHPVLRARSSSVRTSPTQHLAQCKACI